MWTPNPINLQKKEKNNTLVSNQLTINTQNFIEESDNTWTPIIQSIIKENLEILKNKILQISNEISRLKKYNTGFITIIPLFTGVGVFTSLDSMYKYFNMSFFIISFLLHVVYIHLKLNTKIVLYSEVYENLTNLHRDGEIELLKDIEYRSPPNLVMLNLESHYKKIIKRLDMLKD